MCIRDSLNGEEAQRVLALTADGARSAFECSVSCIGGKTCQVGVRDSQGLLSACVEAVRAAGVPEMCIRDRIKNVAGVGRIDDQKADSQLLLFRQFVRMQPPEITQCEITRAGHGGVGTAVAAGPQEQCPAKGPAIFCAEQRGRSPVSYTHLEASRGLPAMARSGGKALRATGS